MSDPKGHRSHDLPPPEARPPQGATESVSTYRRRLKHMTICPCDKCCALQPWRKGYFAWKASKVRKLMGATKGDDK